MISYISKEDGKKWQIKSLNPLTGRTKVIANTLQEVEDICWLNNNTILSGKDGKLYKLTLHKDNSWKEVADLSQFGVTKITRLATNANGSKILIAADIGETAADSSEEKDTTTQTNNTVNVDAAAIVQKHIEPYNTGNLTDFANAFAENVVVNRFPNEKMYESRKQLKQNYENFFSKNKNLSVLVNNRIVLNNFVIDEEISTKNNSSNRHATIYTTGTDGIRTMTFVPNSKTTTNPEAIIDKQLNAYNKRDINAFTATYTKDVKLYRYPNKLQTNGQAGLRKGYLNWFEQTKDLRAVIKKRIVLGNKVIDKEEVTANGKTFNAIAIYEVKNGLIKKVTFIQQLIIVPLTNIVNVIRI